MKVKLVKALLLQKDVGSSQDESCQFHVRVSACAI